MTEEQVKTAIIKRVKAISGFPYRLLTQKTSDRSGKWEREVAGLLNTLEQRELPFGGGDQTLEKMKAVLTALNADISDENSWSKLFGLAAK